VSAHTPGPLTVKVSERWPFDIETYDARGVVIFSDRMPCHSTEDKTAKQAIECRHFARDEREQHAAINRRAIADAVLRAAAPDLLAALRDMVDWLDDGNRQLSESAAADVAKARSALSRATGEAA
jgi:hypothetical protein